MKIVTVILLCACSMSGPLQAAESRNLSEQQAHAIVQAAVPKSTQQLPGYGLDDSPVNNLNFYFVEVTWDNHSGSVVWENFAVDKATGDIWSTAVCRQYTSRKIRAVQERTRNSIGLTPERYQSVKRAGPMCD